MAGAKGIRGRVEALGRRRRGARLPEDLREEIGDYARRRRERGGRVREIADEVGVSRESIRRWSSTISILVPACREDGLVRVMQGEMHVCLLLQKGLRQMSSSCKATRHSRL